MGSAKKYLILIPSLQDRVAAEGDRGRAREARLPGADRAGGAERAAVGQETREGQEGPRQDGRRLGTGMG